MSETTRRRAPLFVGVGLAVILGACAIGGFRFLGPYLSDEYPATLRTPPEVAGLTLGDDPALADAAAQLIAATSAGITHDEPVVGVYVDPEDPDRTVVLWGGTELLRDPGAELDQAFAAVDAGGVAMADVRAVDAGPPGGVARCGRSDLDGVPLSVCGWADHGSLVMVIFFQRDLDASAALFRTLRAEIRQAG